MDSAHEESGPVSRPQPLPSLPPDPINDDDLNYTNVSTTENDNDASILPDSILATSFTSGVSVTNGTVLPQLDKAPPPPTSPPSSPRNRRVSGVIPPYWSHYRNTSRTSQSSIEQAPAITLEDHTEDPNSETSRGLWAKSVSVDDHAVVQGKSGVGSYVVWNCKIQTLDVG